jgi:hypothetical protein
MAARRATADDVHVIAASMPHVTCYDGRVYQVGGKSFVFFRTPRPDAVDPETGERYDDVIVLWVASEGEKQALLESGPPWFTTPHFDGHPSVLVRASHLDRLDVDEVREVVQDAWLAQASARRRTAWLREQGLPEG